MRAFAIDAFGEQGSVRELPDPEPNEGEVLVRVRAASLNAVDAAVVNGFMKEWMEHRFPLIPGIDASGVIEAIGPGVDGFAVGDEVYGVAEKPFFGQGSFAELMTTPAQAVGHKPASLDHSAAATLPLAGLTALSAVEAADPGAGQTVVVLGATGGVGGFVTELAAKRGARVVAVARGEYAEYAKGLGASDTIDYTTGDLAEQIRSRFPDGIDAIVDAAGGGVLTEQLLDLVRRGGRAVSVGGGAQEGALEERGLRGGNANRGSLDRLEELSRVVSQGDLRIPDRRTYPLEGAADALAEQAGRHVRGKLVLEVA